MSDKHEEMYEAIDRKNWDKARDLILSGVEEARDYYDYDDWPLIFLLIEAGQEDLAILWLDNGYAPYITGGKNMTGILHWAAKYGMAKLVQKMMGYDLDIDEYTMDEHAPLWYASNAGHLEIVKQLLEAGMNPDGENLDELPTPEGIPMADTPLCAAANAEIAKLLLANGATLEIGSYGQSFVWTEWTRDFGMDDEILTPLTIAALRGRMDVARLFHERGIPLDSQPLRFLAVQQGDDKTANAVQLIRMGTNPNGGVAREPLLVAARAGNTAFCRMLLENGATPVPDCLSLAVLSENKDCVELFLNHGDPASAIRTAAKRGVGSILDSLLEFRPDLAGHALLGAIEGCRLKLAREMLAKGADPNFRDRNGKTPLMLLYSSDRIRDSYRYFRLNPSRYPADWGSRMPWRPTERDFESDNYFPFCMKRPNNWTELLNLIDDDVREFAAELISKGADIHARDKMDRSILWHACQNSWLKSIPWLAALGLDINARDREGMSAFDAGCLHGERMNVDAMLSVNPEIDAQDAEGNTALIKCGREYADCGASSIYSSIITLLDAGADPDIENHEGVSFRKIAEGDRNLKYLLERREGE